MAALRNRDQRAFAELYDRYQAALYGIANTILRDETEAQDVLQEAFLRIWRSIDRYDDTKASVFTWMLNITRNLAIDRLRRRRSAGTSVPAEAPEAQRVATLPPPAEGIGVAKLLEILTPEQQRLMQLVYYQGFTQAEAAEHEELPLGTVKSRIRTGLQRLRAAFDFVNLPTGSAS